MRNLVFLAGLFLAMPLAAQQPAPTDGPQPKLEAPPTAAPEPEPVKPKPVPAPVAAKPKTAADPGGRVVEEIIARVNNEIITKSEYDKSLASAEEDAKQECENPCTPQQITTATTKRKKSSCGDWIDQSLRVQTG